MVIRRLAFAVGLLFGLLGSQLPEFAQQYRQRLGGALDELQRVISDFDEEVSRQSMTRQQGIEKLHGNQDTLAQLRGDAVADDAVRLEKLARQKAAIETPGPVNRLIGIIENFDPATAKAAIREYEPAIPVTFDAFVVAGLFLLVGWTATHVMLWPLRRRVTLERAPARELPRTPPSSLDDPGEREIQAGITSEYRGYRFKFSRTNRYAATIWATRSLQPLSDKPVATLREGEGVLLKRVESAIDADIDRQTGTISKEVKSINLRRHVALAVSAMIALSFAAFLVFIRR